MPSVAQRENDRGDWPCRTRAGIAPAASYGHLMGAGKRPQKCLSWPTTAPTNPRRGPATRRRPRPRAEIESFLAKVKSLAPSTEPGRRGRLIFALDATMSRQPTWDTACRLQADMFTRGGRHRRA